MVSSMVPVVFTIAGSDSSGGAGVQADLKTFSAFGVYGASAITALTAQNTRGVRAIADLDPGFIAAQIDAVADDFRIAAAKTGMLSRATVIEVVAERLRARRIRNLVVDPVLAAVGGDPLLEPRAIRTILERLTPMARIVTPNLREAELLLGRDVRGPRAMGAAARELVERGARAALITGGALKSEAIDVFSDGRRTIELRSPRAGTARSHGAGCTLSAAIAALLARGEELLPAVRAAKAYVYRAIRTAPRLGHGVRPLNHLVSARSRPEARGRGGS